MIKYLITKYIRRMLYTTYVRLHGIPAGGHTIQWDTSLHLLTFWSLRGGRVPPAGMGYFEAENGPMEHTSISVSRLDIGRNGHENFQKALKCTMCFDDNISYLDDDLILHGMAYDV